MTDPSANRKIIVLTAPSGSGKTSIAEKVMEYIPEIRFAVSVTTRPPRDFEQDGVHYHFIDEERFRRHINDGDLLEYEEVYPGRFYGTLISEVEHAATKRPVLLDIDVKGALNVKAAFGHAALTLFIRPPSLDVLEQRLRKRATESEETLRVRIERAKMEMATADRFDATVVNDSLKTATMETLRLINEFLAS